MVPYPVAELVRLPALGIREGADAGRLLSQFSGPPSLSNRVIKIPGHDDHQVYEPEVPRAAEGGLRHAEDGEGGAPSRPRPGGRSRPEIHHRGRGSMPQSREPCQGKPIDERWPWNLTMGRVGPLKPNSHEGGNA